jgi:hypothetical protein
LIPHLNRIKARLRSHFVGSLLQPFRLHEIGELADPTPDGMLAASFKGEHDG